MDHLLCCIFGSSGFDWLKCCMSNSEGRLWKSLRAKSGTMAELTLNPAWAEALLQNNQQICTLGIPVFLFIRDVAVRAQVTLTGDIQLREQAVGQSDGKSATQLRGTPTLPSAQSPIQGHPQPFLHQGSSGAAAATARNLLLSDLTLWANRVCEIIIYSHFEQIMFMKSLFLHLSLFAFCWV